MSAELTVAKKMALPGDVNRLTECQVRSYMEMDSTYPKPTKPRSW